ncbi:Alpha/beta hydrolase fold-1 [Microdochium bolleyi]|uniref:Alpha/beta hydrolase fold-1 n=1 Tax=Microdochium bolleyi TaxID=196109 RepID=A0A136J291_9PEZI|nr:Alpha/beta hydrolase fold-1 [Microdochium bolleyi]
MTRNRRPAVLVVHGSWHRPCHYELLSCRLRKLGFETACPALPSIGKDRLGKTWQDDVQCIRDVALRLFAKNKQVLLLAHSYGGIPASIATEGLTRPERAAAGLPGGFCHVAYMSAFALPASGLSLLSAIGGSFPDWMEYGEVGGTAKDRSTSIKQTARQLLYNGVPDERADWAMSKLVPQSQLAVELPVPFAATDVIVPKTFVVCEQDLAMSVEVQEMIVAAVPGMRSERISAGHSPFLSHPYALAQVVATIARRAVMTVGDGQRDDLFQDKAVPFGSVL